MTAVERKEQKPEEGGVTPPATEQRELPPKPVEPEDAVESVEPGSGQRNAPRLPAIFEDQLHGWEIYPRDESGIIRGGIRLGQLRVWIVPKEKIGQLTKAEFGGGMTHPGLYVLLSSTSMRAYVGESHDIQGRLSGHARSPPKEQGEFDTSVILNDGRNSANSVYNEHTLRQSIEQSIVTLLTEQSPWTVTNKVKDSPPLSTFQKILFNHLDREVAFALYQLRILDRLPRKRRPELEVASAEVARMIPNHVFEDVAVFDGKMDGEPVYFRSGADKHKVGQRSRWQVTIPYGESLGIDFRAGRGTSVSTEGPSTWFPWHI